jgi:hypothetical protein
LCTFVYYVILKYKVTITLQDKAFVCEIKSPRLSVSVTVIVLYVASKILLGNLDAEGVQSLLLITNYHPPLNYIVKPLASLQNSN